MPSREARINEIVGHAVQNASQDRTTVIVVPDKEVGLMLERRIEADVNAEEDLGERTSEAAARLRDQLVTREPEEARPARSAWHPRELMMIYV
jgi:hypothetical protein